jgi:hypothetical protein
LLIAPQANGNFTTGESMEVRFVGGMDLTGYSGTMTVGPALGTGGAAALKILGTTDGSFDLVVNTGGFLTLSGSANITNVFASATLGTTALATGTYTLSDLTGLGLDSYIKGTTGSIQVIPEPATLGLIAASGSLLLVVRRMMI